MTDPFYHESMDPDGSADGPYDGACERCGKEYLEDDPNAGAPGWGLWEVETGSHIPALWCQACCLADAACGPDPEPDDSAEDPF